MSLSIKLINDEERFCLYLNVLQYMYVLTNKQDNGVSPENV